MNIPTATFVKFVKIPTKVLNETRLVVRQLWSVDGVRIIATSQASAIAQYNKI